MYEADLNKWNYLKNTGTFYSEKKTLVKFISLMEWYYVEKLTIMVYLSK